MQPELRSLRAGPSSRSGLQITYWNGDQNSYMIRCFIDPVGACAVFILINLQENKGFMGGLAFLAFSAGVLDQCACRQGCWEVRVRRSRVNGYLVQTMGTSEMPVVPR